MFRYECRGDDKQQSEQQGENEKLEEHNDTRVTTKVMQ